jgi:Lrp/AsnC family leucine-responsive transcriptional regulator
MGNQLDQIDQSILDVLSVEGRISVTDLAERVGLSKTPCHLRLKRLQTSGYITGFKAVLNAKKLGLDMVAFVEVKMDDTREGALRAFNDAVRKVPEIEMCHLIAGSFDYLLKIRTRSVEDYRRVLGERISTLPHVASTSTHVSMQDVQDA